MHGYEAATVDSLKPLMYIHIGLVDWKPPEERRVWICRENLPDVGNSLVQGYLAHKKQPPPPRTPTGPSA